MINSAIHQQNESLKFLVNDSLLGSTILIPQGLYSHILLHLLSITVPEEYLHYHQLKYALFSVLLAHYY